MTTTTHFHWDEIAPYGDEKADRRVIPGAGGDFKRVCVKAGRSSGRLPIRLSTRSEVRGAGFRRGDDLQQRALGRVHRGFLQHRRRHFAEAFEAADFDLAPGLEGFHLLSRAASSIA
jgi:hypothetical protein